MNENYATNDLSDLSKQSPTETAETSGLTDFIRNALPSSMQELRESLQSTKAMKDGGSEKDATDPKLSQSCERLIKEIQSLEKEFGNEIKQSREYGAWRDLEDGPLTDKQKQQYGELLKRVEKLSSDPNFENAYKEVHRRMNAGEGDGYKQFEQFAAVHYMHHVGRFKFAMGLADSTDPKDKAAGKEIIDNYLKNEPKIQWKNTLDEAAAKLGMDRDPEFVKKFIDKGGEMDRLNYHRDFHAARRELLGAVNDCRGAKELTEETWQKLQKVAEMIKKNPDLERSSWNLKPDMYVLITSKGISVQRTAVIGSRVIPDPAGDLIHPIQVYGGFEVGLGEKLTDKQREHAREVFNDTIWTKKVAAAKAALKPEHRDP